MTLEEQFKSQYVLLCKVRGKYKVWTEASKLKELIDKLNKEYEEILKSKKP